MENQKTINLKYGSYQATPKFAKYTHNGRTALLFEDDEGGYIDGSVNIEDAPIPNNDYIAVKSYAENEGMDKELIRLGLIEEDLANYAFSGFIVAPVYRLTDKAIELRDKHFKELGI